MRRKPKRKILLRILKRRNMFLEIKTPYTQWFEHMCDCGFTENLDYIRLSQKCEKPLGGRPQNDTQADTQIMVLLFALYGLFSYA